MFRNPSSRPDSNPICFSARISVKDQAAVSDDELSCNKGCIIWQKERNQPHHVARRALPLNGTILDVPVTLCLWNAGRCIIVQQTWRDTVDANAVAAEFASH